MFIFYWYGILGLMDPTPHSLSGSSSKPCLALALPAARLLLVKFLSSTMHRRLLTWKNMSSTRRKSSL